MSTQGHTADPSASMQAASRTHSTDDCPDANMPYVFWECWRPDVNLPYDPYFVSTSEQAITSHLESPDNHQRNVRMRVESQPPRDNISVLQLSGSSMPEPPLSPPLTPTSNSQTCTRAISSTPPTLECPICMKPLVEQMATRCGHMFCEGCIRPAIAVKAKCPICRDDVTLWELRRIYFS